MRKKINFIKSFNDGELLSDIALFVGLVQIVIGIIFLIPPILGSFFFTLTVFGCDWSVSRMENLKYGWSGESISPAPIYLGLMAIAGTMLIHSAIKNFISSSKIDYGIDSIEKIEITDEKK